MSDSQHSPRPGTLRSLLGRIVSLILVRAEIFSLEAHEQKIAVVCNLGIAALAFGAGLVGILTGILFVAVLTPPAMRATVLGVIALGFILLALAAIVLLKRRLNNQTTPFALTLSEVQKDWDALHRKD